MFAGFPLGYDLSFQWGGRFGLVVKRSTSRNCDSCSLVGRCHETSLFTFSQALNSKENKIYLHNSGYKSEKWGQIANETFANPMEAARSLRRLARPSELGAAASAPAGPAPGAKRPEFAFLRRAPAARPWESSVLSCPASRAVARALLSLSISSPPSAGMMSSRATHVCDDSTPSTAHPHDANPVAKRAPTLRFQL
jgi:hypothetical protein